MRRQILRFPVGPQFRKILEDDHEWYIVTDLRLKIIAAKRGEKKSVPDNVISSVFKEVIQKTRAVKNTGTIRVYDLHTHPELHYYPSPSDIGRSVEDKLYNTSGVHHAGFGVVTKKGIIIWKLPENRRKLGKLGSAQFEYEDNFHDNANEYFRLVPPTARKKIVDDDERNTIDPSSRIINRLSKKSFNSLLENRPDMRAKTIRKSHRLNMRRRR